jgi:hypothetical protein
MRYPSDFRQTSVTRLAKAVRAAGLEIARVEVKDGAIIVVPCRKETARSADTPENPETPEDLRELI